jgi:hypothetical protein
MRLHTAALLAVSLAASTASSDDTSTTSALPPESALDARALDTALEEIQKGRRIFRHDTFGNQAFWGGQLRLHEAIAGRANGGTGPGLSPKAALALGLKVDVNALPAELQTDLRS